eukprot:2606372-Rhodomonas_salina.1
MESCSASVDVRERESVTLAGGTRDAAQRSRPEGEFASAGGSGDKAVQFGTGKRAPAEKPCC